MLKCLLNLLAVFIVSGRASAADAPAAADASDKDLPGIFQTLSITGPRSGKFICPVCETGLDPGVIVFFRELEEPDRPLSVLLKKLDVTIVKRPEANMGASAILLNDGGYREAMEKKDVTPDEVDQALKDTDEAINRKDALTTKFKDLAKALGLKNLILCLGMPPAAQKKYQIDPEATVTVLIYSKQQIMARHDFKADQLNETAIDAVIKEADAASAQAAEQRLPKKKKKAETAP